MINLSHFDCDVAVRLCKIRGVHDIDGQYRNLTLNKIKTILIILYLLKIN
jgi:hypothetical protein